MSTLIQPSFSKYNCIPETTSVLFPLFRKVSFYIFCCRPAGYFVLSFRGWHRRSVEGVCINNDSLGWVCTVIHIQLSAFYFVSESDNANLCFLWEGEMTFVYLSRTPISGGNCRCKPTNEKKKKKKIPFSDFVGLTVFMKTVFLPFFFFLVERFRCLRHRGVCTHSYEAMGGRKQTNQTKKKKGRFFFFFQQGMLQMVHILKNISLECFFLLLFPWEIKYTKDLALLAGFYLMIISR